MMKLILNLIGMVAWAFCGYLNGRLDGDGETHKGLQVLVMYLLLTITVVFSLKLFGVE